MGAGVEDNADSGTAVGSGIVVGSEVGVDVGVDDGIGDGGGSWDGIGVITGVGVEVAKGTGTMSASFVGTANITVSSKIIEDTVVLSKFSFSFLFTVNITTVIEIIEPSNKIIAMLKSITRGFLSRQSIFFLFCLDTLKAPYQVLQIYFIVPRKKIIVKKETGKRLWIRY